MSNYDVYGIGNALVDMEIEVTSDFLSKNNIEKGVMTLVDQNRQSELLNAVSGIQHRRTCGGSAANTVIAVSQLGGNSFYSCKVASDETGDFYFHDLKENGVSTNLETRERESGVTGKCMVFVTPDADRTMNTYLGITETFSKSELVVDQISKAKYLYIEGYLVTSPTGREAAIEARKIAKSNDVKVALTFSDPAMPKYFRDGLLEMIGEKVDLLFCNEEEAMNFTEKEGPAEAFEALKKYAKTFVITQGPKGALIWDGEKEIDVVASKVDAVDTNGAGDLFAGSFIYGITNGHSFSESGKLACAAASKLVTQFGARLAKPQALELKEKLLGK